MTRQERSLADLLEAAHPRPWDWTWVGAGASGHFYLTDANGRKIGVLWGKTSEKEAAADLIIALVNAPRCAGCGDMKRAEEILEAIKAEPLNLPGLSSDTCLQDVVNEWSWETYENTVGAPEAVYAAILRVLERSLKKQEG